MEGNSATSFGDRGENPTQNGDRRSPSLKSAGVRFQEHAIVTEEPQMRGRGRGLPRLSVRRPSMHDRATDTIPQFEQVNSRCYFNDNKRQIDMILVYETDEEDVEKNTKRETFEQGLSQKLELETHTKIIDRRPGKLWEQLKVETTFVKIHIPTEVFEEFARLINMKKEEKKPQMKLNHKASAADRLDGVRRKLNYPVYTAAQRSFIVWNIMAHTKFGPDEEDFGIHRLLSDGVYQAAYPLHDGRYKGDDGTGPSARKTLYEAWGWRWWPKRKRPLWKLKFYFGDKVALYFAWLGFYTYMLIIPAIAGIGVFLYGVISLALQSPDTVPSEEICEGKNVTMCPLCDQVCDFTTLDNSCVYARISYLFDNPATVAFSVFMSFWATTFLEMWKRYQAVLDWKWNLSTEAEHEPNRPEYEKVLHQISQKRISKITFKEQMTMPSWDKVWRKTASFSVVLFMLFVVLAAVVGTIVYRVSLLTVIYSTGDDTIRGHAKILTTASAAGINLIIILILTKVYENLAHWLTHLENPRTNSEYENSYTFKMYVFQFVNYYSSLVYIAFFKGRFFTYPGDPEMRGDVFLSLKRDVCDPAGCLSELFIQLAIIMVGKQTLNNIQEFMLPFLKNKWNAWRYRTSQEDAEDLTQWEEDRNLQEFAMMTLFEEYLEMVLQYGFVTLFVAAFPLAPAFALLNNIFEEHIDANKFITQTRRPIISKTKDIGAWFGILQAVTYLAVATNAFVIAYTTEFIPRLVYKFKISEVVTLDGFIRHSLAQFNTSDYAPDQVDEPKPDMCYYRSYRHYDPTKEMDDRYELTPDFWYMNGIRLAFVVVFEHIVFALTGVLAYVIPDVPSEIKSEIQKERKLATHRKYRRRHHHSEGNHVDKSESQESLLAQ